MTAGDIVANIQGGVEREAEGGGVFDEGGEVGCLEEGCLEGGGDGLIDYTGRRVVVVGIIFGRGG